MTLRTKCRTIILLRDKSAAQGSRRVELMFKQASLKAFTSDFDVCDKGDSLVNKHCLVKSQELEVLSLNRF